MSDPFDLSKVHGKFVNFPGNMIWIANDGSRNNSPEMLILVWSWAFEMEKSKLCVSKVIEEKVWKATDRDIRGLIVLGTSSDAAQI